jgi:hypothetical protein
MNPFAIDILLTEIVSFYQGWAIIQFADTGEY